LLVLFARCEPSAERSVSLEWGVRKVIAERVARSDLCGCVGGILLIDAALEADVWEMGILSVAAMMGQAGVAKWS